MEGLCESVIRYLLRRNRQLSAIFIYVYPSTCIKCKLNRGARHTIFEGLLRTFSGHAENFHHTLQSRLIPLTQWWVFPFGVNRRGKVRYGSGEFPILGVDASIII